MTYAQQATAIRENDVELVGDGIARYDMTADSQTRQHTANLPDDDLYAVLHETVYQLLTEDAVEQVDVVYDDLVTSVIPRIDVTDAPDDAATAITDYLIDQLDQTPEYIG